MSSIITLLTDFGTQDTFAGVMKGVVLSLAPEATLIDLTHQVPPQDIRAGAFALKTAYRHFPLGTIHLIVVDPGVGSARQPIAAQIGEFLYVCPDNGLLSYVLERDTVTQAVILDQKQYQRPSISRTFHGRDIFAPAAAHLANGVPLNTLGTRLDTVQTFPLSRPSLSGSILTCHVIARDVFGNLFTDLTENRADTWPVSSGLFQAGSLTWQGVSTSYSDVPEGEPLAIFGSSGHLEIAVRNGSARQALGITVGDTVMLRLAFEPLET